MFMFELYFIQMHTHTLYFVYCYGLTEVADCLPISLKENPIMPQTPAEGLKPGLLLVSARSDTSSKKGCLLSPANWHQKVVPPHTWSGRSLSVKNRDKISVSDDTECTGRRLE